MTWGNAPATVGNAARRPPAPATATGTSPAHVQAMYDSAEHNGWLIRDADENQDSEQQFHSREKGSDLPQLVLRFKPAAAPPPPPPADTTPPETTITAGPVRLDERDERDVRVHLERDRLHVRVPARQRHRAVHELHEPEDVHGPRTRLAPLRGAREGRRGQRRPDAVARHVDGHDRAGGHDRAADDDRQRPDRDAHDDERDVRLLLEREPARPSSASSTPRACAACTSPVNLTGLSLGNHTFEVQRDGRRRQPGRRPRRGRGRSRRRRRRTAARRRRCARTRTPGSSRTTRPRTTAPTRTSRSCRRAATRTSARSSSSTCRRRRRAASSTRPRSGSSRAAARTAARSRRPARRRLDRGRRQLVEPARDDRRAAATSTPAELRLARVERRGAGAGDVLRLEPRLPHPRREREPGRGAAVLQPREGSDRPQLVVTFKPAP